MFRKSLIALAATAMVASPLMTAQAVAQPGQHRTVVKESRNGHNVVVRHDNGRRWAKGQRFDRRYATNYRVIDNYRGYRLSQPPRGYHWVRSGNDAVLVAVASGVIASVLLNAIR